jgi:hypothetical protein
LVPYFWLKNPETFENRTQWIEYLKTVASGFSYYAGDMLVQCQTLQEFLLNSGQHLALEDKLNRNFDPIGNGIYIEEENFAYQNKVWYLDPETDPINKVWYIDGETNPALEIWYLDGEEIDAVNFTVYVPTAVYNVYRDQINATLKNYVVNGYTWDLIPF